MIGGLFSLTLRVCDSFFACKDGLNVNIDLGSQRIDISAYAIRRDIYLCKQMGLLKATGVFLYLVPG